MAAPSGRDLTDIPKVESNTSTGFVIDGFQTTLVYLARSPECGDPDNCFAVLLFERCHQVLNPPIVALTKKCVLNDFRCSSGENLFAKTGSNTCVCASHT